MSKRVFFTLVLLMNLLLFVFVIIPSMTDEMVINCKGVGMDSSGIIYIGGTTTIKKYNGKELIDTIPHHYRGYYFEVENNDTIRCCTETDTIILTLDGDYIQKIKGTGTKEYERMKKERWSFTGGDGEQYTVKKCLGRIIITSEHGDVIWETPFREYFRLVLGVIFIILLEMGIVYAIYHFRIKEDWKM